MAYHHAIGIGGRPEATPAGASRSAQLSINTSFAYDPARFRASTWRRRVRAWSGIGHGLLIY